jgi:serine/threonine protein kinase
LNPLISCQAEEIVLRALQRDPVQRYSSAAAMMHDLEHPAEIVVSGLRDRLQPVTRGRRARRLARYLVLVGVVPVASQVVLFVLLWYHFARRR